MTVFSKEQAASREKTLLTSFLLSAPGPLVTGFAALTSHSTTQLADFIRRSAELVALFLSWWIFRKIQRDKEIDTTEQVRLERTVEVSVAGAMICSGTIMLIIALSRLSTYEPGGNVISGLIIAVLGLITNGFFWWRYAALTREQYSPVTEAQQKMYRAKASVDLCVVSALLAVAIAPTHPATRYVDIMGSIMVAIYLLWSGLRMINLLPGAARKLFARLRPGARFPIGKSND